MGWIRCALVGVVLAWAGCAGDPVEAFRIARETGTPEAYVAFMERHSRDPLALVAQKELAGLREQLDWEAAERADSPEGYQRFIAAHPKVYRTGTARERRDRLIELRDWENAQQADHVEAYAAFIRRYPLSEFNIRAGWRIEEVGGSRHVAYARRVCAQLSRETGAPVLPVYAFVPIVGRPYAVLKERDQSYRKLTPGSDDGDPTLHLAGIDAPALRIAPPRSGIVIYMSWELIASEDFEHTLRELSTRSAQYLGHAPEQTRMRVFRSPDAPPRELDDRGRAISWFGNSRQFRRDLSDTDAARRARAAQGLGLLGDEGAASALAAAWDADPLDVRNAAAVALLRLRSDYARGLARESAAGRIGPLREALSHWDPAVVDAASALLTSLRAPPPPVPTSHAQPRDG